MHGNGNYQIPARLLHWLKFGGTDYAISINLFRFACNLFIFCCCSWVVCFDSIAELIIAIYRVRRETSSTSASSTTVYSLTSPNAADSSPFFSENAIEQLGVGFPTILLYRQFCKDLCMVKECPQFWERVHEKFQEKQAEEEITSNRRRTLMVEKSFREVDMGLGITRRGSVGITSNESGKMVAVSKSLRSTVLSPVNFDKFQGPRSNKNNTSPKTVSPLKFSSRIILEDVHEESIDEHIDEHQPTQEEIMDAQSESIGQRRRGTEVGSVIADNRVALQNIDQSMESETKVVLAVRNTTLQAAILQATTETGPVPEPPQNYVLILGTASRGDDNSVGDAAPKFGLTGRTASKMDLESKPLALGSLQRGMSSRINTGTGRESGEMTMRSSRMTARTNSNDIKSALTVASARATISRTVSREQSIPVS